MAGVEGRAQLLIRLADALEQSKEFFGEEGRPGNMLGKFRRPGSSDELHSRFRWLTSRPPDHILSHPATQASSVIIVPVPVLWNVLMNGLAPIWPPSRTAINGVSLGDAWPCSSMPQPAQSPSSPTFSPFPNTTGQSNGVAPWESILPFHKLTQWLTYSLMQPMQSIMKMQFAGQEMLTGLPEYRNGGLFIDLGVLTLKPADHERGLQNYAEYCRRKGVAGVEVAPMFEPGDDVIVEWRGVTVGFLDMLCAEVNKALRNELAGHELSLAQVLEAGSWKVRLTQWSFSALKVLQQGFADICRSIVAGRSGDRRSQPAEYEGATDFDRQRRDCILSGRVMMGRSGSIWGKGQRLWREKQCELRDGMKPRCAMVHLPPVSASHPTRSSRVFCGLGDGDGGPRECVWAPLLYFKRCFTRHCIAYASACRTFLLSSCPKFVRAVH